MGDLTKLLIQIRALNFHRHIFFNIINISIPRHKLSIDKSDRFQADDERDGYDLLKNLEPDAESLKEIYHEAQWLSIFISIVYF